MPGHGKDVNCIQGKDGQFFLLGIEFVPVKGVKVAPNYQGWKPADDNKSFIYKVSLHVDIWILPGESGLIRNSAKSGMSFALFRGIFLLLIP